jgi:hypothetical protein
MVPRCPAPGTLQTGPSGEALCLDALSAPVAWENVVLAEEFDPSMVDAASATAAFGAGFLLYATFWTLTAGIVLAVRAFRNL